MKLNTVEPGTLDLLAAFLPVGGLLAVLGLAEGVRMALPEPFGIAMGNVLAVGGAWLLAWCISPVQQKESA